MATDWKKKALNARTSLVSNGALCALSWTPAGTDNGPRAVAPPAVAYQAWAAIFDYNREQTGTQADSLIKAGDRQLLLSVFVEPSLAALPPPPKGALIVAPDGLTYKVDFVKTVAPAGVAVLYDVNVRL